MIAAVLLLTLGSSLAKEPIRRDHLPASVQVLLPGGGANFESLRARLEARTAERLRRGEDEHLIYFVLQSRSFTQAAPLEPAVVARDSRAPPRALTQRIRAFLSALERPSRDERLDWFRRHLPQQRRSEQALLSAWAEAAAFLREKEFGSGGAEVYQTRGHSSDTSLAPSYAVWNALGVIAGLGGTRRLNRVLIIGPGLDFAPRTGFDERLPPRSYQPLLTAHSLLSLGLSDGRQLQITASDINPRVLAFVHRSRRVELPAETGNAEYRRWLRELGTSLEIPQPVHDRMRAEQLDIVTERLAGEQFDLIVATNVLVYFDEVELPLAFANIAAMLAPGGWFVHNEARPSLENVAQALEIPAVQGRTIEVGQGRKAPLVDAVVIHQRGR